MFKHYPDYNENIRRFLIWCNNNMVWSFPYLAAFIKCSSLGPGSPLHYFSTIGVIIKVIKKIKQMTSKADASRATELIIKQFICQIRMPIQYIQYIWQSEYYQENAWQNKSRSTPRLHGKWTIITVFWNTQWYNEGFLKNPVIVFLKNS